MNDQTVLRVMAKFMIPFILVFGLYVITHGEIGPGGGFQGGVIVASAFILYGLVFGRDRLRRAVPTEAMIALGGIGVLIYSGVGVWTMLLGGNFLDYAQIDPHHPGIGEAWGMTLVEYGVGVTVSSVMVLVYDLIAEREA